MSLIDIAHPFAGELTTIISAVECGMGQEFLPEHLKMQYTSPLNDRDGCFMLRLADWERENIACLTVPVFCDEKTGPSVDFDGTPRLTGARLIIRDFLGREFSFRTGNDEIVSSPFSQVDVVEEGLIFYIEPNSLAIVRVINPDNADYDLIHQVAKEQSSLEIVHEAAVTYLEKQA